MGDDGPAFDQPDDAKSNDIHQKTWSGAAGSRLAPQTGKSRLDETLSGNSTEQEAQQQLEKLRRLIVACPPPEAEPRRVVHQAPLRRPEASLDLVERHHSDSHARTSRMGHSHSRSPPRTLGNLDSPFRRPPALLGPFATGIQTPEVITPLL